MLKALYIVKIANPSPRKGAAPIKMRTLAIAYFTAIFIPNKLFSATSQISLLSYIFINLCLRWD